MKWCKHTLDLFKVMFSLEYDRLLEKKALIGILRLVFEYCDK